jgi:hypothetical protein
MWWKTQVLVSTSKKLRPPANTHVSVPSWKQILQLQPSFQMTPTQSNSLMQPLERFQTTLGFMNLRICEITHFLFQATIFWGNWGIAQQIIIHQVTNSFY